MINFKFYHQDLGEVFDFKTKIVNESNAVNKMKTSPLGAPFEHNLQLLAISQNLHL
jgi:hypothetical protein